MNEGILRENKKRKIPINSNGAIIGLISSMGAIMILTFVTLIL